MDYKKLLIISNAAISDSNSNGRTIKNLIYGWDKLKLAQFYTYGNPDFDVCDNYYRVSDNEALKSFIKLKSFGGKTENINITTVAKQKSQSKKIKKTPLKSLLREIVWGTNAWNKQNFKKWVDDFSPEVIFLFMGDTSFLLNIAMDIAKKKNIPLIVYSCENYYFKNYNYLTKKKSFIYTVFHKKYVRTVKRLSNVAESFVFISEALMNCYKNEFPHIEADFIMTASGLQDLKPNSGSLITYAGNLGIGRHKALIEIGNALQEIDKSLKITLFGKSPNKEIGDMLVNCEGIDYKGLVPYSEVISAIQNSKIVIHTEYKDEFYIEDLKYAFSTKISDCVSSGVPFFCYASRKLPFTDFLIDNKCAIITESKDELAEKLKVILFDENERELLIANAKVTAQKYFNQNRNLEKFRDIISNSRG